jgi:hypothetical protein
MATKKAPARKRTAQPTAAEIQAKADRAAGITTATIEEPPASNADIARDLEDARRLFEEAQARAIAAGIASPAVHIEKTHSATVWIGCKIPNGLLLQLHTKTKMDRPVQGGGIKEVAVYLRDGEPVRLRGPAVPFGAIPRFTIEKRLRSDRSEARVLGEPGLSRTSPWIMLKEGLVFVPLSTRWMPRRKARDQGGDIMSGLEPLSGPADRRVEKLQSPNLADIANDGDRDAFKQLA